MRRFFRTICALALAGAPAAAAERTITLLATTDLHGNLYPVDYYTAKPAARGLAKIATLVRQARLQSPDALLIDCGDTIEGTPLESLWQQYVSSGALPLGVQFPGPAPRLDPMMAAMNALGYAAMTTGNHEFNFGLDNLNRARQAARFPWLAANIEAEPGSGVKPFSPYVVVTRAGVRIAIIGLTTPAVPNWEEAAHYRGYRFTDAVEAARRTVAALGQKERPDLVIAAVHAGLGTREPAAERLAAENMAARIAAEVPGIDAIVFGHSHQQLAGERINGVLLVQPKNWGASLARLDFTLDDAAGRWQVVRKESRLVPVTADTPADPEILAIARPYHEAAERFLEVPVANSAVEMDGRTARYQDTPLVDAIHAVQMDYAHADVSFTALFHTGVHVAAGPVTVRQLAALYLYDNELYAIEGDGRMIRAALENAARYFRTCPDPACSLGPLLNSGIPGFNYDMAEGVTYEIDLTRREGERIVHLERNGRPLEAGAKFRIALNNYRAGGSGGYDMFRGAKVLWKSNRDIRSL
ncbi:MAG TPA: bifunctional UDP-sugar hydrolase/5'-nucleotidase, partial [Bryobacteraceae bacterium]|nr:bifunctional UDP-sugar hydrolase/5'-nucleotidase [Bryobacteraceae bacterium]